MIRVLSAALVLIVPCLVGCGGAADRPALVPVTGTVTFNGEPIEGVTVTFSCKEAPRSAIGTTDSSGRFSLTSYDSNDGAVAGEHSVTFLKVAKNPQSQVLSQENAMEMMAQNTNMMKGKDMAKNKPELVLPAKFSDAETSGEKRKVVAGDANDFKFDLKG